MTDSWLGARAEAVAFRFFHLRPEFVLDFLGANHFGFRSRNGFARTGFQRKTRKKKLEVCTRTSLVRTSFGRFVSFRVVSCRFVVTFYKFGAAGGVWFSCTAGPRLAL